MDIKRRPSENKIYINLDHINAGLVTTTIHNGDNL